MTSEYFRGSKTRVWHIAPAFSHLPLPERNAGRALCGYRVSYRADSTLETPRAEDICEKCAGKTGERRGVAMEQSFEAQCVALARVTGMRAAHARLNVGTWSSDLIYEVSRSPERLWEWVTVYVSPRLGYAVCCLACGEDIPCAHAGSALLRAQGRAESTREVA